MGNTIGGTIGNAINLIGQTAAGGVEGAAAQALSTSVGSVAQGVGQLSKTGIASAKSAFENALPAIQNAAQGPLGTLGSLGGLPGPSQFLQGMGNLNKNLGSVVKHLQDPGFKLNEPLKQLDHELKSSIKQSGDPHDIQRLENMQKVLSDSMQLTGQLNNQQMTKWRG